MKRIILSVMVLYMAASTLQAQDVKQMRERKKQSGSIMHNLLLSDEQKQKIKSYNEDLRSQIMDLRKNDNMTMKEYRTRMESLRKNHKEQIQSLLSSEQKSQIEKAKHDHKAMHAIDAKARAEKMKVRLDLNNDQSGKISDMYRRMAEKMKTIRENESLNKDQKIAELKALKTQQKDELKSILTKEQLQKMKETKRNRVGRRS